METKTMKSGISRREFLQRTGGLAALAAGSGLTTLSPKAQAAESSAAETSFVNMCRGNCGGRCILRSTVREGKIVKTRPEDLPADADSVWRHGCVRGSATPQRMYGTERILYPLKRVEGTERGAGEWERISWEEALDTIAGKWSEAIQQYGNASVSFWHSFGSIGMLNGASSGFSNNPVRSGQGTGVGFERLTGTLGATIWTPSADYSEMYMQYAALFFPSNSQNDIERAKTILIWGNNPTDATRNAWPFICRAKESGATVITIDPQFTTAAAHSDMWVPIRPGTDGALMLAMFNYALENKLIDEDYLAHGSVAPLLIREDGSYVHMSDMGVEPQEGPMDRYGRPTVIDPEVVFDQETGQFAPSSLASKPALYGSFDYQGEKLRTVFDLVTESVRQFDVEFAAEECGLPQEQILFVADVYARNRPSTICSFQGIGHHGNSRHNYKDLALLASATGNINVPGASIYQSYADSTVKVSLTRSDTMIMDGTPQAGITGLHLPEIMATGKWAGKDFPVKCLYFCNGNPLASDPGRIALIEAVKQIDFVVTADSFMTDTAKYSDIVLPICLSWEEEDIMSFSQHVMLMQKAVEPAGECRSDMDVYRGLADRLGFSDLYTKTDSEYIDTILCSPENTENQCSYSDLQQSGYRTDYDYPYTVGVEYNPTGRTQFYLPVMPVRDDWGQTLEETERMPWYEPAFEATIHNADIRRYPFFGLSDHNNYHAHSLYNGVPALDELRGEPYVCIHEEPAAKRGIQNGDMVKVFNDRGFAVLRAVLTKGIRKDTVLMPHGWQSQHYVAGHHQDLSREMTLIR